MMSKKTESRTQSQSFSDRLTEWKTAQPENQQFIDAIKAGKPREEVFNLAAVVGIDRIEAIALIALRSSALELDAEVVKNADRLIAEHEAAKERAGDLAEQRDLATTDRERDELDDLIVKHEQALYHTREQSVRARLARDRMRAAVAAGLI